MKHEEKDEIPIRVQSEEPEEEEEHDNNDDNNDDNDDDGDEEERTEYIRRATSGGDYRKLATIVAVFAIVLGFVISTYQNIQTGKPKVIYATRYSKEHRFRPAASPIVTETLRDGRVRIRGAQATMSVPPKPTPTPKRQRKRSKRKTKVS
ncbi:hypothetical protein APHAL10511_000753 [Amanita phalloides]|nr:hypothetical protein APHAL10511_000753 [Amanita phalloides]